MKRGMIEAITGILLVIFWITLGLGNLLLIILGAIVGYLVATITGTSEDKFYLKTRINKLLRIKE